MDNLNITRLEKGVAKSPFNRSASATTLMLEDGQLFIGSTTDFSGTDPAILRVDVAKVLFLTFRGNAWGGGYIDIFQR